MDAGDNGVAMPYHVPTDEFERIAAEALETIPETLRAHLDADNVMITIQPGVTEGDHGMDRRVLGYYEGSPGSAHSTYPHRIVLFQGHIENVCSSHGQLVEQVTDTVLHEVGHYFGLSHADISETRLRH